MRHVEPARPAGHDAAHPAHAQDAEPLARDLRADHERGAPVLPPPFAHELFAFAGTARGADHQHHRELGSRVRQHVGRVGHDDAPPAGGLHVHVVVADGEVGDDPDLGGQPLDDVGVKCSVWHGRMAWAPRACSTSSSRV